MIHIRPIDEELNRVVTIIEVEDDVDVSLFMSVYRMFSILLDGLVFLLTFTFMLD